MMMPIRAPLSVAQRSAAKRSSAAVTNGIMRASPFEKLVSALGAVLFVGLFGYLLVIGLTVEAGIAVQRPVTVIGLRTSLPRHRPRPPIVPPKSRRATKAASPGNLKNKAAEITAPPHAMPQLPSPVIVAVKTDMGAAPYTGASDRSGVGEAAGGNGTGTGGDGDGDTPPRQVKGRLKFSDLPADLRNGMIGGTVSVRYGVDPSGKVSDCAITVSSGNAELDQLTCQLIQQRFRFVPSRDENGRPVFSTIEEKHIWEFDDKSDEDARR